LKDGQFAPKSGSFTTGQVFNFVSAPPTGYKYGFDISITVKNGQTDPFGSSSSNSSTSYGVSNDCNTNGYIATGRVSMDVATAPVPEPPFLQLGSLLGCAGLLVLWKKRFVVLNA
jgi:hypothetical protein